jgi:hypothetical protein
MRGCATLQIHCESLRNSRQINYAKTANQHKNEKVCDLSQRQASAGILFERRHLVRAPASCWSTGTLPASKSKSIATKAAWKAELLDARTTTVQFNITSRFENT